MVKKSSFLDKLFGGRKPVPTKPDSRKTTPNARDRKPVEPSRPRVEPTLRQASAPGEGAPGVGAPGMSAPRVESAEPKVRIENGSSTITKQRVEVEALAEAPRLRSNKKEDAASALVEGFKDLSGLLHGIQDRMDEQTRRSGDLGTKFDEMPEMARAQIEFMGKISEKVVSQEERTKMLVERLSGLPDLLDGLHKTLEKQLEREERTENTLAEFRGTMDRIHESIGTLSRENQVAMSTAVESFERSQDKTTSAFSDAQRMAHETFSETQNLHLKQINEMVDRTNRANKNMVWLMVIVLGALIVLFIAVLNS